MNQRTQKMVIIISVAVALLAVDSFVIIATGKYLNTPPRLLAMLTFLGVIFAAVMNATLNFANRKE